MCPTCSDLFCVLKLTDIAFALQIWSVRKNIWYQLLLFSYQNSSCHYSLIKLYFCYLVIKYSFLSHALVLSWIALSKVSMLERRRKIANFFSWLGTAGPACWHASKKVNEDVGCFRRTLDVKLKMSSHKPGSSKKMAAVISESSPSILSSRA